MPVPKPFLYSPPNDQPKTDAQHAENWRTLTNWFNRQAPVGRTLIYNSTAVQAGSSISFPNLPKNYSHLIIEVTVLGDQASVQSLVLQFNGDTGANYTWQFTFSATGAAPATTGATATTNIRVGSVSSTNANVSGIAKIEIPNYNSGAFYKQVLHEFWEWESDAGYTNGSGGGVWKNLSPITSLKLFPGTGNFRAGSQFSLYGEY